VPASPALANGQYTARAQQSDAAGNVGFSSTSTFLVDTAGDIPPNAAFTFSSPAFAGQPVAFDASGSNDPDGFVSGYSWDFGDATSGTGKTTSHIYATPGTRTVTLTVTDNSGSTGTLAQQVSVTSPSTGSVSTPPPSTPGSPPSTPGSPPSKATATAPTVSASLFSQRLRTVLARGLVVYVGSDRIAKADVALVIARSAARRIGITSASRDVVLGSVVKPVTSARRTRILVKLKRKAKAALMRVSKVTVVLTIKITDAVGRSTTARRKLTLKR